MLTCFLFIHVFPFSICFYFFNFIFSFVYRVCIYLQVNKNQINLLHQIFASISYIFGLFQSRFLETFLQTLSYKRTFQNIVTMEYPLYWTSHLIPSLFPFLLECILCRSYLSHHMPIFIGVFHFGFRQQ